MHCSLNAGEAILEFRYQQHLVELLRAIPGRRWDPLRRVWRVAIDPDSANTLLVLLEGLTPAPTVEHELLGALQRARRRRAPGCLIDLVRPGAHWQFSFSLDRQPWLVDRLLSHHSSRVIGELGRGLLPADRLAAELIAAARLRGLALTLSARAEGLFEQLARSAPPAPQRHACHLTLVGSDSERPSVAISAEHAAQARRLAVGAALDVKTAEDDSIEMALDEEDAPALAQVLAELPSERADPALERWLHRACRWQGTVDVAGEHANLRLLLLGDRSRLPAALQRQARGVEAGVTVAFTPENWSAIRSLDADVSPAARRCAGALERDEPIPAAVLELSQAHREPAFVLAPGHDRGVLERFAALTGAQPPRSAHHRGHEHQRLAWIRADPFCVAELDRLLAVEDVLISPDALDVLQAIREQHAQASGLLELSAAHSDTLEVPSLAGQLEPFQRAGVRYLLRQRRVLLADEQGLGKTIQALATLRAADAFPAVVLCPAAVKLNWLREIARWLLDVSAQTIEGAAGAACNADIIVVGYDIAHRHLDALCALRPRALILDESHYCKNAAAKRTRAALRLSSAVPADGLVLALTGTPVINRPAELISQLRILGRLGDFGSGAEFGRRFRGADAHLRLHWHLRARCMVRRLKSDVLTQLPAKRRSVVPLELDNQLEYELAEHDLIAWLTSQPHDLSRLDAKVSAALRAQRLVALTTLQTLAARGKLRSALAWIHDFRRSGERLVIFARHREIQRAVLERFPDALQILGDDPPQARERALAQFQRPDSPHQMIVCSLHAAGHGLTLTGASNVVFLELDWTPARLEQAEDRCHRIGQRAAVNAWYLLAAGTIDETIAELLERKRSVIAAVTDAVDPEQGSVIDELLAQLRQKPYRHLRAVA